MPKLLHWTILLLALGVAPVAARAATLPFTGSLDFFLTTDPLASLAGSGVATVNGSGGGGHLDELGLPANAFAGRTTMPLFNIAPISGVILAGGTSTEVIQRPGNLPPITLRHPTGSLTHPSATFSPVSGGPPGGGVMPLNGVLMVCLFNGGSGGCEFAGTNLVIPLTIVGNGGSAAFTAGLDLTALGAPWTVGTAGVLESTIMGLAHGPLSLTSSTAQPSGVVSLVSPIFVSTELNTFPVVPAFVRMSLHFVPEPGTFVLLGVGVGLLGARGRAEGRRRKLR